MHTEEMLTVLPKLTESHRFYHSLDHISRMLHAHQIWKHHSGILWTDRDELAIYLTIIYHDVVYDIKKDVCSNEWKSAKFFTDYQQTLTSPIDIIQVENLILATEDHFKPNYEARSPLEAYFLDLDLMQLCTPDLQTLLKDNENIDKEFLTEYHEFYVYESRFNFITGPMQNAKLRCLKNEILSNQMAQNIEYLRNTYSKKF